ncbi:MAG: hypothetical protein GY832_36815 [Chloroflexi bacterium]|nr:hypothetical protein [Chloroflexota bacterium]
MQANNNRQRIIICGTSIFLSAIEAGLAAWPGLEVIHFHPHLPGVVERIAALEPDMVVVEQNDAHGDLVLALLSRGLPLVELDAQTGQGTFLTGRKFPISGAEDMVRLLKQVVIL